MHTRSHRTGFVCQKGLSGLRRQSVVTPLNWAGMSRVLKSMKLQQSIGPFQLHKRGESILPSLLRKTQKTKRFLAAVTSFHAVRQDARKSVRVIKKTFLAYQTSQLSVHLEGEGGRRTLTDVCCCSLHHFEIATGLRIILVLLATPTTTTTPLPTLLLCNRCGFCQFWKGPSFFSLGACTNDVSQMFGFLLHSSPYVN